MRILRKYGLPVVAAGLCFSPLIATQARGQQAPAAPTPPVIHAQVGEVAFDMVATDKHGRVLKDLTPDQVTVLDNGTPQRIRGFHLVTQSVHLPIEEVTKLGLPDGPSFNMTALVFDHMDPSGRIAAVRAAQYFVNKLMAPGDYVAVFEFSHYAYALQPFTTDKAALLKAINIVAKGVDVEAVKNLTPSAQEEQATADTELRQAESIAAGAGRGGSAGVGAAFADAHMAQMTADMLRLSAQAEATDASRSTLNDLLSIVLGLQELPGRKAVVYFEDWFPVNSETHLLYNGVLRQANKSQVSVYPINPDGLSQDTENGQAVGTMQYAAGVSRSQSNVGAVSQQQAQGSEAIEDAQLTTRRLLDGMAHDTGGVYTDSTNDLNSAIRAAATDIGSHYELTYVPSSGFDNQFHTIEVRVNRKDVVVRARRGYFAGHNSTALAGVSLAAAAGAASGVGAPAASADALLLPLYGGATASALKLQREVMLFPNQDGTDARVALQIPLNDVTFQTSGADQSGQVVVGFQVKDGSGKVVKSFSQAQGLKGANLSARSFVFERHLTLPAGNYTVQSAVLDPASKKATVQSAPLAVEASAADRLRLSSVLVVGGEQDLGKNVSKDDPMVFQGTRILPDFGVPLSKAKAKMMTFYFIAYAPQGSHEAPKLTLTFKQGGQSLGQVSQALPAPDASGRIPYLANLPLAAFPAGNYEVDVTVSDAGQTVTGTAAVTVAD